MEARDVRAVWYQPASGLPVWKDRGANVAWGWENEGGLTSVDAYLKGAAGLGLGVILQSDARNPADQAALEARWNDASVVAICISPDEPNGAGGKSGGYVLDRTTYVRSKAPGKPTLVNLDGWKLQYMSDGELRPYCVATDWIAFDWHIVNHGDGIGALPLVLAQLKRLSQAGKPLITFVETGDQNLRAQDWAQQPDPSNGGKPWALRMRGPTVAEIVAEQRAYLGDGEGICYFPHRIGKNWEGFDDTPPEISGALTAINTR